MTTPDERADSSARNAAIKQVDAALKAGRIVQADHDMRVDQLRRAQTMQDIQSAVQDLQAPPPAAPPMIAPVAPTPMGQGTPGVIQDTTTGGPPAQSWPLVNYGSASLGSGVSSATTSSGKGGKAVGAVIALVIVLAVGVPIAAAAIAFFSARNSLPDFGSAGPSDGTTYLPGQTPGKDGVNLFTVDGYNELVKAVQDETHAGFTYETVIYPRYAVVGLPTGTNNRYQDFYWNGDELQLQDFKSTSSSGQVDISLVDPQQMIDCVTTVRNRLDSADSWYAVIDDSLGKGTQITCYATNDYGESSYLIETLDGTVVYDSEKTG